MATSAQWIAGARPRTLPAAIAPVDVAAGRGTDRTTRKLITPCHPQAPANVASRHVCRVTARSSSDRTSARPVRRQIMGRALQGLKIPYTVLDINADQVEFVRRYGNKVYFGDASRIDLLEAAGAGRARVLVVAVGDPEASMRIVEQVKRRFPHLRLYARARNRYHAHLLMRAGVPHIVRELLPASLELTRDALVGLGIPREQAQHTIDTFRPHDEQALLRQLEVFGNEKKLIQTIQEAARELEALYEADEDIATRLEEVRTP